MDSAVPDTESNDSVTTLGVVVFAYKQVMNVLAALSLAFFVSRHFNLQWHGVIAELVDFWGTTVRPLTKILLDNTVVPLCAWLFHWRLSIPLLVRDYLSVGIILSLSAYRSRAPQRRLVRLTAMQALKEFERDYDNFLKTHNTPGERDNWMIGKHYPLFGRFYWRIPFLDSGLIGYCMAFGYDPLFNIVVWPVYLIELFFLLDNSIRAFRRSKRTLKHILKPAMRAGYSYKNLDELMKEVGPYWSEDQKSFRKKWYEETINEISDARRQILGVFFALIPLIYFSILGIVNWFI